MAMLANLVDDDDNKDQLLGAARQLIGTISDLLNAAQTIDNKEVVLLEKWTLKINPNIGKRVFASPVWPRLINYHAI